MVAGCKTAEVTATNPPHPRFHAVGCGKSMDVFCSNGISSAVCLPLPMTVGEYVKWLAVRDMKRRSCSDYTVKAASGGGGFELWDVEGCGMAERHQCREDNGYPQCVANYPIATTQAPSTPSSSSPTAPPPATTKPGATRLVK